MPDVAIKLEDGTDSLSGHDKTVSSVESLTSNTEGTEVVITTTDLAGNEVKETHTIKVDKDSPSIMFKTGNFEVLEQENKKSSEYFDVQYSTSGGSLHCSLTILSL